MDTQLAFETMMDAMHEHGLHYEGWSFDWDRAVRRYGCTHWSERKITLSLPLTELATEEETLDVILHEIAHVLAGPRAGHGAAWRRTAVAIGAVPKRCGSGAVPEGNYKFTCPNCGCTGRRARRGNSACGECCRKYNHGRYSDEFLLTWVDIRTVGE